MRVTLSSITAAQSVRTVLESYGYSATQVGRDVLTDCPTLLAVPVIQRQVGLAAIDRLDLTKRGDASGPNEVGRQYDGLIPAPLPALCSRGAGQLYA
jgi:hypothetical protein